ncbi:hypothetical protein ACF0H5_020835 [Mactra antiquata]
MQLTSLLRRLVLNNGAKMPRIGVGTYLLLGDQCQEVIERAIAIGYRHIDTAWSYENEKAIGSTIHDIEHRGNIGRKQLYITSKLGRTFFHPRDVKYAVEESLDNLQTTYLDMYLIHSPWGMKNHGDGNRKPLKEDGTYDCEAYDLNATWRAMEEAVKDGHVKSIGLSNFTTKQIQMIVDNGKIVPQNVQFECHAYYQQNSLRKFCSDYNIVCTAYSPLGAPGIPDSHQAKSHNKDLQLLEDDIVITIATKYNRSPAQILLRFLLEKNLAVIPKTSSLQRLEENICVFDFELEKEDVTLLESLDRGLRFFMFEHYKDHPYFPNKNEFF